jgi:hypothetical protein
MWHFSQTRYKKKLSTQSVMILNIGSFNLRIGCLKFWVSSEISYVVCISFGCVSTAYTSLGNEIWKAHYQKKASYYFPRRIPIDRSLMISLQESNDIIIVHFELIIPQLRIQLNYQILYWLNPLGCLPKMFNKGRNLMY